MGDIIAAPDRLSLAEVAALAPAERAAFADAILGALATLQGEPRQALRDTGTCAEGRARRIRRRWPPAGRRRPRTRLRAELADGLAIDWLRLSFVRATYDAALAFANGDSGATDAHTAEADAALALAQRVVDARHADLWDAESPWLTERWSNPTIYGYGYLFQPDSLCHWHRERNQLRRLLTGAAPADANCAL